MIPKIFVTISALTTIFLGLLMFPLTAHAQAGRSITIIPPKFELFGNPGDTLPEQIRVKNNSDVPATYSIIVEDFTTSGEEGQVVIEGESESTSYSLGNWIETESQDLILQPNEEKTVSFLITIPRNAEPGGHYASILFQSGGEQVPGSAAVSQRVGSLILLRVSGNVTEDADVESFTVPSYSQSGPIDFTLRVKNNGNVHMIPQGTIIVENILGQKVAELPIDSRNVLSGAIRKMDTVWDKKSLLGRYKATMIASYGQGAQKKSLTAVTDFTVASPLAIILITVGIIAAVVLLIALVAGRKRFSKAFKMMTTGK